MCKKRQKIEHDIWLTAYLTALRTLDPSIAQKTAFSAVKHYEDRWPHEPCDAEKERSIAHPTGVRGYLFSEMGIPDQP